MSSCSQYDDLPAFDRTTRAALRFFAMGFTPTAQRFDDEHHYGGARLILSFRCVCGREEHFMVTVNDVRELRHVRNIYEEIERSGATSREHLLADGYTVEQVNAILARGEKFDQMYPPEREIAAPRRRAMMHGLDDHIADYL